MTRVDVPEKDPVVVSRSDFEADRKRGYATTVWSPAGQEVIKDRRTGRSVTHDVPAVLNYCCMDCQFATTILETMDKHRASGDHLWEFTPFNNPYGHIADVVIEGIEEYQLTLKGE